MVTDDDAQPSPSTTKPKSSTRETAGASSKENTAAPAHLVAPLFPVVDRTDPLHPDQLRRHELTVEQALQAHRTLTRVARNPGQDPSWPIIIEVLRQAEHDYREYNTVARAQYEKQRRFRDLTSRLDMSQLANIRAADEAEGALQDAWLVWRRVYSTYGQIHGALLRGQVMPTEVVAPPEQPDPWPSSGATG